MRTLIRCGCLLDCLTGRPQRDRAVLAEDGVITAITGPGETVEAHRVVDWSGRYVLPGLINCHTHFCMLPGADNGEILGYPPAQQTVFALRNLADYLDTGVTTIRDMGGVGGIDLELRDFLRRGLVQGPDVFAAGRLITMTGGHGHTVGLECDGPEACRKGARSQLKAGADHIKVMATGGVLTRGVAPGSAQLSREEMAAAVEEAHKAGRRVAAHAQGTQGIKNALLAGVDSIEHGFYLDDECLGYMAGRGVYYVPTLCAPHFMATLGKANGLEQEFVEKVEESIDAHRASFRRAVAAGIPIAAGTDAGTPFNTHRDTWRELELMTRNGMTPYDALLAGTRRAAACMGLADRGVAAVGKIADLIAVEGDPLEGIDALSRVAGVVKRGEPVR